MTPVESVVKALCSVAASTQSKPLFGSHFGSRISALQNGTATPPAPQEDRSHSESQRSADFVARRLTWLNRDAKLLSILATGPETSTLTVTKRGFIGPW